ncbi:hypothetical protein C4M96_03505 [Mycoplasmopsis pullorum]|uniref:hypothetical protein n=2 Tax=Mycoplasmopsis pullorum TaxID=48003 RepID=UPI00111A9880|nr:hypothetical protein [Mycoplasmopsis pullorum]TNK83578.1 hypothetical protein C4M93_02025 [Mycoplasmopsis pullorum]TNK91757.1 hypothetical protein C4M96_03505 [Mycoplasmopsis pullorum]
MENKIIKHELDSNSENWVLSGEMIGNLSQNIKDSDGRTPYPSKQKQNDEKVESTQEREIETSTKEAEASENEKKKTNGYTKFTLNVQNGNKYDYIPFIYFNNTNQNSYDALENNIHRTLKVEFNISTDKAGFVRLVAQKIYTLLEFENKIEWKLLLDNTYEKSNVNEIELIKIQKLKEQAEKIRQNKLKKQTQEPELETEQKNNILNESEYEFKFDLDNIDILDSAERENTPAASEVSNRKEQIDKGFQL